MLTALIAIPIVLLFTWFGGWWAFAVTLFVVALGTYELQNMTLHSEHRPLFWVSLGLSTLFLVSAMFPQQRLLLIEAGLGATLLISFPWLFLRKKLDGALVDWALTLAFSLYLGWPMSIFLLLRGSGGGGWPLARGVLWLLVLFGGVWGADSAAFFAGHFLGRHKLAPNISPGKTWEGAIGGLVFSVIATLVLSVVPLGVPWYMAIVLGLLIGVAAVLGDLAESLIKRQTHVKDSGQIMPGHGGMLDRIDSLLFAIIVVYVFSQLIGLLPPS
ncbi:MAG: phosphatidate cytidylyltransferase [Chloroflexota bacterium]|nr:phosphatidate cytidylyltransferase [Chloroflexota bacterium]